MRNPRTFDPFRDLDRLFGAGPLQGFAAAPLTQGIPMDVVRHDDHVVAHFDLPGVELDDIDLTVEKNELVLTVERTFQPPEGAELVRSERIHETRTRRLQLGDNLDAEGLTADYRNGVLEISIPIIAAAKPRKVAIAATTSD